MMPPLQYPTNSETREPVGRDWLDEFRQRFADEFPEDGDTRHHVEKTGNRPVQSSRPGRA